MSKLHILLITGGHPFEREPLLDLFKSMHDIDFSEGVHPEVLQLFQPERLRAYDALVFYDFGQTLPPQAQQHLQAALSGGQGAVLLHHSIHNYLNWPEYRKIVGGQWVEKRIQVDGKEYGPSRYGLDAKMNVRIADPNHPVVQGLSDFEIVDEWYADYFIDPEVQVLLRTDHPDSEAKIAWTKSYGRSKIVYLQSGHGPTAYRNPNFQRLVSQSIHWVSGKGSTTES